MSGFDEIRRYQEGETASHYLRARRAICHRASSVKLERSQIRQFDLPYLDVSERADRLKEIQALVNTAVWSALSNRLTEWFEEVGGTAQLRAWLEEETKGDYLRAERAPGADVL